LDVRETVAEIGEERRGERKGERNKADRRKEQAPSLSIATTAIIKKKRDELLFTTFTTAVARGRQQPATATTVKFFCLS